MSTANQIMSICIFWIEKSEYFLLWYKEEKQLLINSILNTLSTLMFMSLNDLKRKKFAYIVSMYIVQCKEWAWQKALFCCACGYNVHVLQQCKHTHIHTRTPFNHSNATHAKSFCIGLMSHTIQDAFTMHTALHWR